MIQQKPTEDEIYKDTQKNSREDLICNLQSEILMHHIAFKINLSFWGVSVGRIIFCFFLINRTKISKLSHKRFSHKKHLTKGMYSRKLSNFDYYRPFFKCYYEITECARK